MLVIEPCVRVRDINRQILKRRRGKHADAVSISAQD